MAAIQGGQYVGHRDIPTPCAVPFSLSCEATMDLDAPIRVWDVTRLSDDPIRIRP
jgi:hypothetical protein